MIEVRVRNKSTGDESTLPYTAFKDVQYMFDLIGQIDQQGNLIPGDPNLLPEHRRRSASVIVAEVRQTPKFNSEAIPAHLRAAFEAKVKAMEESQASKDAPSAEPVVIPEPEKQDEPVKSTDERPEVKTKRKYTKRQPTT